MVRALVSATLLLPLALPISAHRLDEYLQAVILSVEKDRVEGHMYLTPGVAAFPAVFVQIDTNGDGKISAAEQRAYAERVVRDLSLRVDGKALSLRLLAVSFAPVEELRQGRADIQLQWVASVPAGTGKRKLVFENHHEARIGSYLVNCLAPRNRDLQITAQKRNYTQSFYELDYSL